MATKDIEINKDEVLESILKVNTNYIGNSNSLHKLGTDSKKLEVASINQIIKTLNLKDKEVIFTSGRCESNNLAIYGILNKYTNNNKKITALSNCDSSIIETIKFYEEKGLAASIINDIGKIDEASSLICFNNIEDLKSFKEKNPSYKGHILLDITDSLPEFNDLNDIDFITFDLSKYDLYGIGVLIKKTNIVIEPLFKGGKSTTIYRSGTPALPLIVAFSKYLRLLYENK